MTPEKAFASYAKAAIKNASICNDAHGRFISGEIFGDSQGHYKDGEKFLTSYIIGEIYKDVFLTRTGVTYHVENWKNN